MTNHESGANIAPRLEEITGAYQEILDHNRKNTGFGALFGTMANSYIEGADAVSQQTDDPLEAAMTETDMKGDLQGVFHDDVFSRVGIKITPFGHVNDVHGPRVTSRELVPIVDNTELFTSFLVGLSQEEVPRDENNLKLTADVINTLHRVVASSMTATEDPHKKQLLEGYAEDSLRTFLAIDEEYKRLGIDKPDSYQQALDAGKPEYLGEEMNRYYEAEEYLENYRELGNYVTYWGRGLLSEYVKVGSMDSLAQSHGDYFDGAQDELVQRVNDVVALIGPERTTDYGLEAAGALIQGLEKTLANMDTAEGSWYAYDGNRALLTQNIARLRQVAGQQSQEK